MLALTYGHILPVEAYVKSPVASGCLVCSSVRKRVRVTMSVLILSWAAGDIVVPLLPLAIVTDVADSKKYRKSGKETRDKIDYLCRTTDSLEYHRATIN